MLCKEDDSIEKDLAEVEDEIRAWEKGFEIEFGAKPGSEDISARPRIALKYKLHESLKQALRADKNEGTQNSLTPSHHTHVDNCDGNQLSQKCHIEGRPTQPSLFQSQDANYEAREEDADVESLFDHNSSFLSYFEDSVLNTKVLGEGEPVEGVESNGEAGLADEVGSMPALAKGLSHLSAIKEIFNASLENSKAFEVASWPKFEELAETQVSENRDRAEKEETELGSEVRTTALLPNFFGAGIHAIGGKSASSLSDQVKKNIHLDLADVKEEVTLGFDDKVDHEQESSDAEVLMSKRKRGRAVYEGQAQEENASGVRRASSRKRAKSSLKQVDTPPVPASKKRENFVRLNLKNEYKRGRVYGRKNVFKKISEERRLHDDQEEIDVCPYVSIGENAEFLQSGQESACSRGGGLRNSGKVEEVVSYCNMLRASAEDGSLESEKLVGLLKMVSKFDRFLPGQEQALRQIIQGKSTLLILPTGMGKSLCYQLATCFCLNGGVTIVVSPLVSLMIDQLKNLFDVLRGVSLGYHKAQRENEESIELIKSGNCDVVFVSPERLASGEFEQICREVNLKINLCCVDEAHCISTWSHNFRPAYLSIYDRAVRRLGAKCVLAMTGTCRYCLFFFFSLEHLAGLDRP
ncbi:ATP-dependent DNA helicase Q4-like [Schistocerca gregaria]|uniref:ATP-dependent DNA helicase Q4-like n=1 Tax=Schistocerca gregaria TaxID=7010 RepID=UPI00211E6913|nr:ATP-dependent DNA helicase Q4-like [Schistocerca gregaria]